MRNKKIRHKSNRSKRELHRAGQKGVGSPKSDLGNQLAVRDLPRKSFVMCVALSPKESKFAENE
nr:hypothetical protein [uncultured bacterium]